MMRDFDRDFDKQWRRTNWIINIIFVIALVWILGLGLFYVTIAYTLYNDPGIIGRGIGEVIKGVEDTRVP